MPELRGRNPVFRLFDYRTVVAQSGVASEGAGLSNAELAARLSVSVNTVESHLRSIYGMIGVTRRSAATRFALEHNLV